jgi:adenylate cyclase
MDWDAEGLLEGLPDERAREARRALLDELHEDGVPVEELRAAVDEQRLALLPVDRLLGSEHKYTQAELAEKAGVPLDYLQASRRALGLPVPPPDEKAFGDRDLEAVSQYRRFQALGFDEEGMLEATRVLGRGMARYAQAMRTLGASSLLQENADEHELGRRFAAATEELMPLAGPWLEYVFSLHLAQVLRSDAVTFEEMTSGHLSDTREQAVAFADLVGVTQLGESVPVEELAGAASRLSRLAGEIVDPPVSLVKVIGDAIMLVAPRPAELVETTLTLVERTEAAEDLPPLRAGVACGPAVNRWGDWFGSTVNLSSRLTARARPASVLVTGEVREAAGGFEYSAAATNKLTGFSPPLKTYRARRAPLAACRGAPPPIRPPDRPPARPSWPAAPAAWA